MNEPKFELGRVVMTAAVAEFIADNPNAAEALNWSIARHHSGDWGCMDEEDKRENDFAVENGFRIFSAYTVVGSKIWIITEADRSSTTVLFPEDY